MSTNKEPILQNTFVAKPVYSITPFTLLDYPDKTACILWFAGCNMRCEYCYNPDIVLGKGKFTFEETIRFLKSRKNLLDGVVLSGGECTLHKSIIPFIKEIKALNFLVKIDTNGTNPEMLKYLLDENLIDYVALDFKAPCGKFQNITKSDLYKDFEKTLQLLVAGNCNFEVRTTIHSDLLNQSDIQEMVSCLEKNKYKGNYYLQNYINNTNTLGHLKNSGSNFVNIRKIETSIPVIGRN